MIAQFSVYVLVGVASAAIDVAVLWALLALGVWRALAVAAGLAVGMVANYLLHRRFTFGTRAPIAARSVLLYAAIVAANYVITLAFVEAGVLLGFGVLVGKIASLPVIALTGYLFTRRFVFA